MKPTALDLRELETIDLGELTRLLSGDERVIDVAITGEEAGKLRYASVRFDTVHLSGSMFEGAELPKLQGLDVIWDNCSLVATNLENASLERAEFSDCRADGIQLMEAELRKVRFISCKMTLANFRNARLKNIVFEKCDLNEADFYGATLDNVWFEACTLHDVNFAGMQGKNIDLRTSDCQNIVGLESLSGAVISSQQLVELAPEFAAALHIKVSDD
jgi:uncharacterized protein YjbI with pentapeptide repeats